MATDATAAVAAQPEPEPEPVAIPLPLPLPEPPPEPLPEPLSMPLLLALLVGMSRTAGVDAPTGDTSSRWDARGGALPTRVVLVRAGVDCCLS